MKDLVKKVAVAVATGGLITQAMMLPSFATITVQVTGNGADSNNTVSVSQTTTTSVVQTNDADITNDIDASAKTGGNTANRNTGGDVSVDTGDATTKVEVTNVANSNEAVVGCNSCPTDVSVEVSENGDSSDNDVTLGVSNTTYVNQTNNADIKNDVDADAKTGGNTANRNTGGDVSIDTGDAKADVKVTNTVNANVAQVTGGSESSELEILVTGNGADSINTVGVGLTNLVTVLQNNDADIYNDIEVDAKTGHNTANRNTGGDVSIDTGDAEAGAIVDTLANFNWANVADCCVLDGQVKVAGNGDSSDNDVRLGLTSSLFPNQSNDLEGKESLNDLDVDAKTGHNEVKRSTGDTDADPTIDTGNATNEVKVSTEANSNLFSTGDAEFPDVPDWDFSGSMNWFLAWWSLTV